MKTVKNTRSQKTNTSRKTYVAREETYKVKIAPANFYFGRGFAKAKGLTLDQLVDSLINKLRTPAFAREVTRV